MRTERLEHAGPLPLVFTPEKDSDKCVAALRDFARAERVALDQRLSLHGAVLFRGFPVHSAEEFEEVAQAIDPELKNDYLGTSPRDALTKYVFSASELPPYYPIPQHCEMSFLPKPPRRLMFCCLVAPQAPGGETPLCDFRAVWRDLDPAVRARFEARGVRNVRNYAGPEGGRKLDPWKLKRWNEMFQTTDRARAEEICREHGLVPSWGAQGRLQLVNVQKASRAHPVTGETVWFNHAQVFHTSSAAGEYKRIARRQGPKFALLSGVARAMQLAQAPFVPPGERAMDCTWGDGAPIPDSDMEAVRDAIWKNLIAFRWQRGDVVAIDNFAVSHGRMPYQGKRQVVVAWA